MIWAVVRAAATPGPITRNGARDAAHRELSKGIYHRHDDPWPVRLFNAIQHWLEHLAHSASRHAPGGGFGALALVVAAAALVGLVWWRVGMIRGTPSAPRPVLDTRRQTSADLLQAAEAAAAAGRWEAAVVARMRALAMNVEERGLLDPRPGRTADELAVEMTEVLPAAHAAMAAAARAFDAVAYGKRPATQQTYQTIVAAATFTAERHHPRRQPAASRS